MRQADRDKLERRLAALECRQGETLPSVEFVVVEPTPDGPRDTGERWRPAPSGGFEPHAHG